MAKKRSKRITTGETKNKKDLDSGICCEICINVDFRTKSEVINHFKAKHPNELQNKMSWLNTKRKKESTDAEKPLKKRKKSAEEKGQREAAESLQNHDANKVEMEENVIDVDKPKCSKRKLLPEDHANSAKVKRRRKVADISQNNENHDIDAVQIDLIEKRNNLLENGTIDEPQNNSGNQIVEIDENYVCDICDTFFHHEYDLKIHYVMKHERKLKVIIKKIVGCVQCGKVFKEKMFLEYHGIIKHRKIIEKTQVSESEVISSFSELKLGDQQRCNHHDMIKHRKIIENAQISESELILSFSELKLDDQQRCNLIGCFVCKFWKKITIVQENINLKMFEKKKTQGSITLAPLGFWTNENQQPIDKFLNEAEEENQSSTKPVDKIYVPENELAIDIEAEKELLRQDEVLEANQIIQCEKCNKTFNALASLKIHHSKMHCKQCDFNANKQKTVKKHIEEQHKELVISKFKPIKCNICEKGFVKIGNLKNHIGKVHGEMNIDNSLPIIKNEFVEIPAENEIHENEFRPSDANLSCLEKEIKVKNEIEEFLYPEVVMDIKNEDIKLEQDIAQDEDEHYFKNEPLELSYEGINEDIKLEQDIAQDEDVRDIKNEAEDDTETRESMKDNAVGEDDPQDSVEKICIVPGCEYQSQGDIDMMNHKLKAHVGEKKWGCRNCSKMYINLSNLTAHSKDCDGDSDSDSD